MALPAEYKSVIDVHQEGARESRAFFDSAEYRDNLERFTDALEVRPTPHSYKDGAIALRGLIRLHKKNGRDYHHLLAALYRLACEQEFMCSKPYVEGIGPGYNIAEEIGVDTADTFTFNFDETGIECLPLLNITDRKLLLQASGQPHGHLRPSEKYLAVWDRAEQRFRNGEAKIHKEMESIASNWASSDSPVDEPPNVREWPVKLPGGLVRAIHEICGPQAVSNAHELTLVGAEFVIAGLRAMPAKRLAYAARLFPYPSAYKEAAIALRGLIKAVDDDKTDSDLLLLQVLFRVACEQALLYPDTDTNGVIARISAKGAFPREQLDNLQYPAQSVSTDHLPLLTTADRRRLQPWFSNGPGAEHPFTIHQNTWKHWAQRYSAAADHPSPSTPQRQATPQQKRPGFWGAVRRIFIGDH